MKKVVNVGIGGKSFVLDEDAYHRLDVYLERFRKKVNMGEQTKEVMDDLEGRIAELIQEALPSKQEVVNLALINRIVSRLGMPDSSAEEGEAAGGDSSGSNHTGYPVRKFYRDPDHRALGGVCGGVAAFLGIDVVLVRVIFLIAFFMASLGFWVYVILWIIAPIAYTPSQKCEMYGLPVTAENMNKFSRY